MNELGSFASLNGASRVVSIFERTAVTTAGTTLQYYPGSSFNSVSVIF